ncbi:hypothetical protein [Flavobacterium sp.]|uniref:hypothetical protein n=1 Tax=Flavobacterium sp. TaxID=239 RepID=UPI00403349A8
MKKLLVTSAAFLAFTALAIAQEKQDVTQRIQPVITHQQVKNDEKAAIEQRKKLEKERHAQLEKQKREESTKVTSTDNDKILPKKTSTTVGEQ